MKNILSLLLTIFIYTSAISQTTQLENQNKKIMNKYLLHGKLTAKDGYGEKLTSILLDASKLVSTAKGKYKQK